MMEGMDEKAKEEFSKLSKVLLSTFSAAQTELTTLKASVADLEKTRREVSVDMALAQKPVLPKLREHFKAIGLEKGVTTMASAIKAFEDAGVAVFVDTRTLSRQGNADADGVTTASKVEQLIADKRKADTKLDYMSALLSVQAEQPDLVRNYMQGK